MFDPKTYQKACDDLTLAPEKLERMIQMTTENAPKRSRRALRVALIAAACVAALSITAFAAVPAVQEFFASFTQYTMTAENGEQVDVSALATPYMTLEDREGRKIFTLDDREYDITDALEQDGKYVVETDNATITVTPDGTATLTFRDTNESFAFDLYDDGMGLTFPEEWQGEVDSEGNVTSVTVDVPENGDETQSFQYTENDDGTVTVTDSEGNALDPLE